MRQVKCTLPEGGEIIVRAGAVHRVITGGMVVDLDQVLVPATPETRDEKAQPAVTFEAALGHHAVECFEPLKSGKAPAAPREE